MMIDVQPPDTAIDRKARGAFFTPPAIADFLAGWAIRGAADRVLEPSCGEAAFLTSAAGVLGSLAGAGEDRPTVHGVEIHGPSAEQARRRVVEAGGRAQITIGDFFAVDPTGDFDAVIGNPPYVRYQSFTGPARARARAAALAAGVPISALASSWAAFTVHAAQFLSPGGRLGLVLPAELLSVNYAADVRRFLLSRFGQVTLVLFTERVFPGVQEEVVLLLAEGYDEPGAGHAVVHQARNADELGGLLAATSWTPPEPGEKWTPLLMAAQARLAYTDLLDSGAFVPLQHWGETTLGMVTGNNKFFALTPERVDRLALPADELLRLSPPGSRHLRGLALTGPALRSLGEAGAATWLFRPGGDPGPAARRYIAAGETAGVDQAYKCRVRTPWWRVPLLAPADLLITYMNADSPRITTNSARAHHLNSVHGIYLSDPHRELGRQLLPIASLSSLTRLGAETVGRSYGGGVLKLEPREADRLPVPGPELVAATAGPLRAALPRVRRLLAAGRLGDATGIVDAILLREALGRPDAEVELLGAEMTRLAARRSGRAGRG